MSFRLLKYASFLAALCAAAPALAGTQTVFEEPTYRSVAYGSSDISAEMAAKAAKTPDFFYVGLGAFDFDKDHPHNEALDFRGEYRWGMSLLPALSDSLAGVDRYVQVHPLLAGEVTAHGAVYGLSGLAADVPFLRHGLFTWSEGVGLFDHGNQNEVGSIVEFRSQLELGWRFNNEMRLVGFFSHISNGGLTPLNPGEQIAGAYLGIPLRWGGSR